MKEVAEDVEEGIEPVWKAAEQVSVYDWNIDVCGFEHICGWGSCDAGWYSWISRVSRRQKRFSRTLKRM